MLFVAQRGTTHVPSSQSCGPRRGARDRKQGPDGHAAIVIMAPSSGFGGVGTKPCTRGDAVRYSSHAIAGVHATSTRASESARPISVPSCADHGVPEHAREDAAGNDQ